MVNPHAYFDTLSLVVHLQPILGDVDAGEIQLFAYLARLLSLYAWNDQFDWRYEFATTQYGLPYSRELTRALDVMMAQGILTISDNRLLLTPDARQEYDLLLSLPENADRERFIDGSSACCLSLPVGFIRNALSQEPDIRSARTLGDSRMLLSPHNPTLPQLYEQFAELRSALGEEPADLMLPAVLWLRYLYDINDSPATLAHGGL